MSRRTGSAPRESASSGMGWSAARRPPLTRLARTTSDMSARPAPRKGSLMSLPTRQDPAKRSFFERGGSVAPSLLQPTLSRRSSLGRTCLSSPSRSTGTSSRRPAPAHYNSGQCINKNSEANPVLHGDPSPGTVEDFSQPPPCFASAGETPAPAPAATAPGRGPGTSGHCPAPAPAASGQCVNHISGNNLELHGVLSPGAREDVAVGAGRS